MLFQLITEIRAHDEAERQQKRVAQGGPLVMKHRAEAPAPTEAPAEVAVHRRRVEAEKMARFKMLNSFGELAPTGVFAAQAHFEARPSCVNG